MTHGLEARRLLRRCRSGALATLSKRLNGHPYASVVPFMSNFEGRPVLLVSRLAEHTKNMEADPRVSLLVHEPGADIQAAARLTIVGTCVRIEDGAELRERYLRRFPDAHDLLALDFDFHRITPTTIRFIGGFGKIHWVEPRSFLHAGGIDDSVECEWLDRFGSLYREDRNLAPEDTVHAVALDCDGLDIRAADGSITRLEFSRSTKSAADLPAALRTMFPQAKS